MTLALVVILAHLADLLTFFCASAVLPLADEANPLARFFYDLGGLAGVTGYKVVGVSLIAYGVLVLPSGLAGWLTGVAAVAGLVGAVINTAAVVLTYA